MINFFFEVQESTKKNKHLIFLSRIFELTKRHDQYLMEYLTVVHEIGELIHSSEEYTPVFEGTAG